MRWHRDWLPHFACAVYWRSMSSGSISDRELPPLPGSYPIVRSRFYAADTFTRMDAARSFSRRTQRLSSSARQSSTTDRIDDSASRLSSCRPPSSMLRTATSPSERILARRQTPVSILEVKSDRPTGSSEYSNGHAILWNLDVVNIFVDLPAAGRSLG